MSPRGIALLSIALIVALASAGPACAQAPTPPPDTWPRTIKLGTATALIYQPQVEAWQGNRLDFRVAVGVTPAGAKQETFGMVAVSAQTLVDRVARVVTLDQMTLSRVEFPALPDRGASYAPLLRTQLPAVRTIALDRLQASLAASGSVKPTGIPVVNEPPQVIVGYAPALLVPIDGAPVIRPVPSTQLERVLNTRALILRPQAGGAFYLHVYDGWLEATSLAGPWYQAAGPAPGLDQVAADLGRQGVVDLLDGGGTTPRPLLAGGVPVIHVTQAPAELVVFKGQPSFLPIGATGLEWAANTTADVIVDTNGITYYVLLSGRWFRAQALTGPWVYVASTGLPPSFQRIPPDTPAGVVLASVAGTPQAAEAIIANSIPQTATISRVNGPKFSPVFDGAPELQPIAGTALQHVVNSPTPIISLDPSTFYALQAGVWYSAMSLSGPWYVAAAVPAVIYTIPASSPLHYVTYVQVYGSTATSVSVGYTPGYLGTVVAPDGVVVYGTGYAAPAWIGTAYYPPPPTYGVMAQPVYNPAVGMTFGFAMGLATASATSAWGGSAYYHPAYYGYPCCGSASANVYGAYGSTAYSGTRSYSTNPYGYSQTASGSYTNYRTGTTGTVDAQRSVNYAAGTASQGYQRSFDTPYGTSGSVSRGESYDASTGRYTYNSSVSATGPQGQQASTQRETSTTPYGQAATERQTTSTNPDTGVTRSTTTGAAAGPEGAAAGRQTTYAGQSGASVTTDRAAGAGAAGSGHGAQVTYTNPSGETKSAGAARSGNDVYADKNGSVYRNSGSGSGWEQHGSGGWQSASATPSWGDREQQARSQGESRYGGGFGGGASSGGGWGGGGGGSWGSRFGGFHGRR